MSSNDLTQFDVIAPCYSSRPVDQQFERFRLRVLDLLDEKGIKQKELRGHFSEGWISNKLRGRRGLSFSDVQLIADALHVSLSELVRDPSSRTYDLTSLEARMMEAFRKLEPDEQLAAVKLLTVRQRTVGRPAYPTSTEHHKKKLL